MSELNQDEIGTERIRTKIRELEERRDKFLTEANQTNAAFSGAIQALQELLNPPTEPAQEALEGEVLDQTPPAVEAITA